jgi:hypothetical protein
MNQYPEELKRDIGKVRDKVKEARRNLTDGVVEDKARAAGKSVSEYGEDAFDTVGTALWDLSEAVKAGAYRLERNPKGAVVELGEALYDIHSRVREKRRSVTGGAVEDTVVHFLGEVEKELDDLLK